MNKIIMMVVFIGLLNLFGSFILMYDLFLCAYNSPDKQATINIDSLGEAKSEYYFVMPFIFLTGLFGVGYSLFFMHKGVWK